MTPAEAVTATRLRAARHLFYETSHGPALADLVGPDQAGDILDFCFAANPYYPTPDMLADLQAQLPALIKSYPSCDPNISRRPLAAFLGADPDRLLIGNGASEIVSAACRSLARSIGIAVPAFGEYLQKLRSARAAKLYRLRADQSYRLNLAAFLAWIRSNRLKAALVINPANPSGQFSPLEDMRAFLTSAQDLDLVIVDESFIDFAGDPAPSLLTCAADFPNVLVVRSMSKPLGAAGLRLGCGYSSNRELLDSIRKALPAWNMSAIAEYFLSLLPATAGDYERARKAVIEDTQRLFEGLRGIPGLTPYPTGANFVLGRIDAGMGATELRDRLLREHNMYVLDCANKVGMDGRHVRIASQGRDKDRLLTDALKRIC